MRFPDISIVFVFLMLLTAGAGRALAQDAEPHAGRKVMRGPVVFSPPDGMSFHVMSGGEASGFRIAPPLTVPEFGSEAEVEYDEASRTSGGWDALAVRVTGKARLPEPTKCTPDDVLAGRYNRHWAEVEGVVVQVKYSNGFLWLQLAGPGGWGMANIYRWPPGPLGDHWWGARVRMRGIALGRGQNAFRVHSPELMEVLEPGSSTPFDLPFSETAAVSAAPPASQRVKLKAIVLGASPTTAWLRAGGQAFQAEMLFPFDSNQDPSGRYLDAPKLPFLLRGQEVDVVGSPLQVTPFLRLQQSQFKITARDQPVAARAVDLGDAATGTAANDLVSVRGRLTAMHETQIGSQRRETLELSEGGRTLGVLLDSDRGGNIKGLAVDDLVEVTGLLRPAMGNPPWAIHLNRGGDVASLGPAPEVVRRRWMQRAWWIGGALVLGAAGLFSVRQRRQRQIIRESVMREANTVLEQRVTARTAELERAREELDSALAAEREIGELKSRFVALVSHEFRTPLGVTMSAVELLRHYTDRLPPAKREELQDDIFRSTKHMAGLMEQVLVLGRVEAGRLGYKPADLDVPVLMQKLCDESLSAFSRKCPVRCEARGDFSGASGDESLLRHVFGNLLSNALKYSSEGAEVEFTAERDGLEAVFTVRDRGIGIPEADIAKLFQAFQRGSNVGEVSGTGLGLVIVKRCVETHDGVLTFASVEGEGTTFTVRVPLF